MATVLDIIRRAAPRCGIRPPEAALTGRDKDVLALLAHLQAEGQSLARANPPLRALVREAVFDTVAGEDQGGLATLAPGYLHIHNGTFFERDGAGVGRAVAGPLTVAQWQEARAGGGAAAGLSHIIIGGRLKLHPDPGAGRRLAFAYVTAHWVAGADGTEKPACTADDDTPILDDYLLELGAVVRFKAAAGLDSSVEADEYRTERQKALGRDGGKSVLSLRMAGRAGGGVPAGVGPAGSWTIT